MKGINLWQLGIEANLRIRLYDLKKRKELGALAGQQQGDINAIEFYGKYMLSASDDGTICIWRSKDWELLKTMKGHQ
jgi:protein MAK11